MVSNGEKVINCKKGRSGRLAIPVHDQGGVLIGYLNPVGQADVLDVDLTQRMSDWRKKFMDYFLTRFESTREKTAAYMQKFAVDSDNSILFLIRTAEGKIIGYIGLSNINESTAELYNLIRGEPGGHPRLMWYAELGLLRWAFDYFNLISIHLFVLSYNWRVLEFHGEAGFRVVNTYSLQKECINGEVTHKVVPHGTGNVPYEYVEMLLNRESFSFWNVQIQ